MRTTEEEEQQQPAKKSEEFPGVFQSISFFYFYFHTRLQILAIIKLPDGKERISGTSNIANNDDEDDYGPLVGCWMVVERSPCDKCKYSAASGEGSAVSLIRAFHCSLCPT